MRSRLSAPDKPARRKNRTAWAWAGVGFTLAFLGIVAWFAVASASLDSDAGAGSSSDTTGALRVVSTDDAVAPFTGLTETRLGVAGDCRRIVIADALAERIAGLRGQTELAPYDGMLFVFDEPTTTSFTMSGVPVPLDIGFYDGEGRPVSRLRMEPCDKAEAECPLYEADGPFEYALETEAGQLDSGALTSCPS